MTSTTELIPLLQILLEFQELTEDEESLYYDYWCIFCGSKLESQEQYNSHSCAAKSILGYSFQHTPDSRGVSHNN